MYCVLCTVYCVLCAVCCVLCTVYCVLCAVCCVLCTVYLQCDLENMKFELNVARDFKDVYKIVELEPLNLTYFIFRLTPFGVSGMSIYRLFAFLRAHQLLSLAIACQGRMS